MTWLVTGATGHLGANLVRRLLSDGQSVRVLLRPSSDNRSLDDLPVEKVFGDLRRPDQVAAAVAGCEGVYHTAAIVSTLDWAPASYRREVYETNLLGTRYILQSARQHGVKRVVVTGSISATGHSAPTDVNQPVYPFEPMTLYSTTKVMVEHECLRACAEGQDVVIATSTALIGPNDFKPSRLGRVLVEYAQERLPAWLPGGFTFVSTEDVSAGHVLAMQRGRAGQKYIFTTEYLSFEALLAVFKNVTGKERPKYCIPGPVIAGLAWISDHTWAWLNPRFPHRFTSGSVRVMRSCRQVDSLKAQQELGYTPGRIADAAQAAYDCFRRRGVL